MTFFANAGVKWPHAQSQLREAGTHALLGGAELWRLFSEIEAWESDTGPSFGDGEATKTRCVQALQEAADSYSKSLDSIGVEIVRPLNSVELDLVAPPYRPGDRHYYDDHDPFRRGELDIRGLYAELIERIQSLVSQIRTLDLKNDRRDLAFQVFRAMRDWELISWNARLIAVLNRRPESAG
jgi:hypothetical protein